MRMMFYSVSDTGVLPPPPQKKKKKRVLLSGVEPSSSSDVLPLSYRRLVGAKAIKLKVHGTNILHTARIEMSCVAYAQWNKCDGIF